MANISENILINFEEIQSYKLTLILSFENTGKNVNTSTPPDNTKAKATNIHCKMFIWITNNIDTGIKMDNE